MLPVPLPLLVAVACALLVWLAWREVQWRARLPLRGRRVLISGCDSGIGRAAALRLAARGATVYAGCLTRQGQVALQRDADADATDAATSATKGSGTDRSSLHALPLDVTNDASVAALMAEVERLSGGAGLDALLNNAGVMSPASLVELTPLQSFQRNIDVNFLGAVRMTQAALPLLRLRRAHRGSPRIINVTSFLGRVAPFSQSAYCSSKFALEAFSAALRAEQRAAGVSVCIIQPGTTRTELGSHMRGGMERCWAEAAEDQRARLGDSYLRAIRRSSALFDLFGRDVSSLLPEVEHAVCARWPRDRYICGWDSFLFGQLLPLLPAWICDAGCLLVLGWPRPAGNGLSVAQPPVATQSQSQLHDNVTDASAAQPASSTSQRRGHASVPA